MSYNVDFLVNYNFFNSILLLFFKKHISLIVFFCNFAPENHNSQKREQK